MKLHRMGIYVKHYADFVIDRPMGSPDNLLLIFMTQGCVETEHGPVSVQPGSCILYRRGVRQLYYATGKTYVNHYVHFALEEEPWVSMVPWNEPFYLKNPKELEQILELLSKELVSDSSQREQNEDLLLQLMLSKVMENYQKEPSSVESMRHQEKLRTLRSEIYANPGRFSEIADMAADSNLSLSHFKMLYRDFFGVSCYDDLLTAKMLYAQHYLTTTDLSIKEIAELCGYENDTCFMRSFRKRIGQTPSSYRKQSGSVEMP